MTVCVIYGQVGWSKFWEKHWTPSDYLNIKLCFFKWNKIQFYIYIFFLQI